MRSTPTSHSFHGPEAPPARRLEATILITDIVDSTAWAVTLGDTRWLDLLARHDEILRGHMTRFGGQVVLTTGDGFVAVFETPTQAVCAAAAALPDVHDIGLEIRAGVHTGECEERHGEFGGLAFHIGARVVAKAGPGEVLVSEMVRALTADSGVPFVARGKHVLKGLPGRWPLYAVGPLPPDCRASWSDRGIARADRAVA